ncbi:MAG: tetratricopeptide repeat protein, partial [Candidatus Gastranaerophilales bacterium]|nr:tetratricopeptide repeat protein [Candidatus Gastranaerophilales bacterium]
SLYLFRNSAPVHNMLGKAYELQGNETAALSEYKKSILIKPEYSPAYISTAKIYQDRGDYEMAISELRNAVAVNPNFAEGKLQIAEMSLNLGRTNQAIKYYKSIVDETQYSDKAVKGLAKAYFKQAQLVNSKENFVSDFDYKEAEEAIIKAIQYNPNDLQLYLALLRISRLTDNGDNSTYYLNQIIKAPSNKIADYVVKGEAFIACNEYTNAINEFRQAINTTDEFDDLLNLGEIFLINKQYQAAKEAYNKALINNPNNYKAIKALEKIRKNEQQSIAKASIAKGFYDEGQKMAAIEAYRESLSYNPNYAQAHLNIAKIFEKMDYYFNALEHYIAYINLIKPYESDYTKYLNKIEQLQKKVANMQSGGKSIKKYTRL